MNAAQEDGRQPSEVRKKGVPARTRDLPVEALHPGFPAPARYGDGCFICHRVFDGDVHETEEDVIPKWVLKRLGLGNAGADLPNGQVFGYGKRKVPCCFDCNQRMSASLEKPVSEAFAKGCDAVRELDFTVLFLWLAKVYYGTRYRETGLREAVRDPESQVMLEPSDLSATAEHLRRCLQHRPDQLTLAAQPASIFVFRAGMPDAKENRFDYFVPTMPPADLVAVRCNDVFVIGIFGDNGYWGEQLGGIRIVHEALSSLTLHPVQCEELAVWFASEVGGAHASSGCYDFVTTVRDETPHTVFLPQFEVSPTGVPIGLLNQMRVKSFLRRLNVDLSEDDGKAIGSAPHPPTTLFNNSTQALVQATCFERSCRDVFRQAGWVAPGPECVACGA
ncbi:MULTISPECIES: hypothetical protein [Nocardioides]|uniref:Uncharacterized protein n=2 Tax=Nocardioides TaxID=1839 RepID=A0ABT8TTL3_9ACTN|nr:hypothetical protein [Nocardioides cremeus]MDO3397287.1 hypothetical protein [Nocardioides cremeus]